MADFVPEWKYRHQGPLKGRDGLCNQASFLTGWLNFLTVTVGIEVNTGKTAWPLGTVGISTLRNAASPSEKIGMTTGYSDAPTLEGAGVTALVSSISSGIS